MTRGGDHLDFRGSTFYGNVTGKTGVPAPAPSPSATSTLPAAPVLFTGREDEAAELLRELDPAADEGARPVPLSAIAGLGGVGKTALALHVAHTARERGWFPGGALFIDLRGYDDVPATADQAVVALLRALGVPDADLPPTPQEQYARYRDELSRRAPVLIVLDNASDPAQVARLLPGEGAGHHVLVTSRDALDSLPARQFRVAVLDPHSARDLISRSLTEYDPDDRRVLDEPDAVRELAALCGHLPLALLIASAMLRRRGRRPIATLTAELRAAGDRVHALRARGVDQYERGLDLRPVFEAMYARLEPDVARAFRLLGQAPVTGIGLGTACSLTALQPEECLPLLDDLAASSLITSHPTGRRWHMHDLVWTYVRSVAAGTPALREEATAARNRLLFHLFEGAWSAKLRIRGESDEEVPDLFPDGREQALAWCDAERQTLVAAALWAGSADPVETRLALGLAGGLDTYLEHRRANDDWAAVARCACAAARSIGETEIEAAAQDSLGRALYALRRFEEACDAYRNAIRLAAGLGRRKEEAEDWNNLGVALHSLRRHEEALDAFTRSLAVYEVAGDPGAAAEVRGNLGTLLSDLGLLDEAHAQLTQVVGFWQQSGDRVRETGAAHNLGVLLGRMGRHEEGMALLTHVLGLSAELGLWDVRAKAWHNLGSDLAATGRFEEALAANTRARAWYAAWDDPHSEALVWLNRGSMLVDMGRTREALDAARRARELYTSCEDWHGVGEALSDAAVVHAAAGRHVEAGAAWTAAADAYDRAGAADKAAAARLRAGAQTGGRHGTADEGEPR
jgi:tetratricopeptide (TPR) repeat protein/CheY-like chemotaxis protein